MPEQATKKKRRVADSCATSAGTSNAASMKSKGPTIDQNKAKKKTSGIMEYIEYYRYMKAAVFDCRVCGEHFNSRVSLINHVQNLHGTKRIPNVLKVQSNSIPRKIITKAKASECLICSAKFASREEVKTHFAKQHGIQLFDCAHAYCGELFLWEKGLQNHIKNLGCRISSTQSI